MLFRSLLVQSAVQIGAPPVFVKRPWTPVSYTHLGFTEQQNEHLALLRHEEYSVMWASLLGGFTHGLSLIHI